MATWMWQDVAVANKRPIVFQYMMETPLFGVEILLKFRLVDNYPKTVFEFSLNDFYWIQDKIKK